MPTTTRKSSRTSGNFNSPIDLDTVMADQNTSDEASKDDSDGTPERGNTSASAPKKARTSSTTKTPSRPSNYQSLRRQCNRSQSKTNTTKAQGNIRSISTTYSSRVTVKLSLPSSKDPLTTLTTSFQALITKLKEATKDKVGIVAWKNIDVPTHDALLEPAQVPTTLNNLLIYSPRLFPGKINQPNTVYAKIHIAHESLFTDILSELNYWLRSNNHGIYYNMLQAETVVDVGYLLYSLRCMDAGALAEEIFDLYGIEVGLRWKVISQGLKGKIPADQRTSALHVEASLENKASTIKALLHLYGRKTTENSSKPNGVNFRFVTLRSSATSRASITKLDRLRVRQKRFLTKICQSSSWDIVHLDHTIRRNTKSLRHHIMSLKSLEYESVSIFHSVDLDYNGDGFVFTYLPEIKSEAESAMQTLFPLIRHHNKASQTLLNINPDNPISTPNPTYNPLTDDEIQSFFTQECFERTNDMFYDNIKKCIIDPLIDNNLELVIDDDIFEKLLGPDLIDHQTELHNIPGRPAPRVLTSSIVPQGDADSVSTFGGSLQSRRTNNPNRSRLLLNNVRIPSSDESAVSSNTTVTTEAFDSLNSQVQSITSKLATQESQNNEILKLLRLNTPKPTESAGQLSSVAIDAGEIFGDASEGFE
jgi:hypothetical protein